MPLSAPLFARLSYRHSVSGNSDNIDYGEFFMRTTTTTPAVYVGTYHKYNCGSIFGKWFELTEFNGREDFTRPVRRCMLMNGMPNLCSRTRKVSRRSSSLKAPSTGILSPLTNVPKKRAGSPRLSPGRSIPAGVTMTSLMMHTAARRKVRKTMRRRWLTITAC